MNIQEIVYDKVTIKYTKRIDGFDQEVMRGVRVNFDRGSGRWTAQLGLKCNNGASRLYTKTKVLELSPRAATFEAYWFSSNLETNKTKTVKVNIRCEF